MSIKVAIATADKINIDLHFGKAAQFQIYELRGDHFEFLEARNAPKSAQTPAPHQTGRGGAHAGESRNFSGDNGGSLVACGSDFSGEYRDQFTGNESACGGCGTLCGSGCGGGSGPILPAVELLLDCRAIVAAQVGQNVRRQFEKNAVSVFDIELPISQALTKLAAYYTKFGE